MKNNKPSISIGIPTYEAGPSLVVTLNSLYSQTYYAQIQEILLAVDGNTISKAILQKIKNPKLRIVYFKKREGQAKRLNDLFSKAKSDFLVLTNDDIFIDKKAIENVYKTNFDFDLLMGDVRGLEPKTIIEKMILVGNDINRQILKLWNRGDNYLSCNGRFLVLSKNLYNNINIPLKNWNNDAYMYLYARENDYKTIFNESVKAYFKAPEVLFEHIRQSDKFQFSNIENQKYFKKDISGYYRIPDGLKMQAMISELKINPVFVTGYILIYLYTRLHNKSYNLLHKKFWETDSSTKTITKI